MSIDSHISLLDLSKLFPFVIDAETKKKICFGETLVISCGHYEGEVNAEEMESEWSCSESTITEVSREVKEEVPILEVVPVTEHPFQEEEENEDNDFQFYFYPDCKKPKSPPDSRASVITVDGVPQLNTSPKSTNICTCKPDKQGKCECFISLPCECGAKVKEHCTCPEIEDICVCKVNEPPHLTCTCKGSDVCLCFPDHITVGCTCGDTEKPCLCQHSYKLPAPVCVCKKKPKFTYDDIESVHENAEEELGEEEQTKTKEEEEAPPCDCQKVERKICGCLIGDECICNTKNAVCICDVRKPCICHENSDLAVCDEADSVCVCPSQRDCTCDTTNNMCSCFPKGATSCTCGNPDNCSCYKPCECTIPCVCDNVRKGNFECTCPDKEDILKGTLHTCICTEEEQKLIKGNEARRLKRLRSGKHGYRWCAVVDPRHTFFDYAYGREITYKEKEREKIKIMGLYEKVEVEEEGAADQIKAPPYRKKVRRPSLDCCSSVGGISISIETLGEDGDKFLVQVVSHSSKEGAITGTKLVSILDMNLHTMEENRIEYITNKKITKERRSYMGICDNGYYNKVTKICGDKSIVKRLYHSFEQVRNLLSEGANIVLLRYFGLSRYRGNIKTDTLLIDGILCQSIYVCHGVTQAVVNGKALFVCKVERHIIEPSGLIHQTLTVLTLKGYMVSHEWADNNYIFHINPLLKIIPEKDEIEPHEPLRERWREDIQLLSDYLDFKSTRTSEGARYVSENGSLTNTVRDYLQALLLLRPNEVLHFTRHYFESALSSIDLPRDEYFDSSTKHVRYFFFEE